MDSECINEPVADSDLVAASLSLMPSSLSPQRTAAYVAYVCSVGSALLVLVWLLWYCGGLGWSERLVFNWHPLLMALAWLVCTSQGSTQPTDSSCTPYTARCRQKGDSVVGLTVDVVSLLASVRSRSPG